MFIGRRPDGSIYGYWTVRQADDADHPGQEEVADSHPDLIAFQQTHATEQVIGSASAFDGRQRAQALDDLSRAISAGDTAGALKLMQQLLEK